MKHLGTVEIETDRLLLRKIRVDDAQRGFSNWTSDPKVTKYIPWETHSSVDVTTCVFTSWVEQYDKEDFYQWIIVLKEEGCPIGTISVVKIVEDIGLLQVGYCIGSRWWGRGIVAEAFGAVISFFFEQVGANRVEAVHDTRNPNSGKVMLKCGLKHEGTLRQASKNNQGICDSAVYAILAEDYFASKGNT